VVITRSDAESALADIRQTEVRLQNATCYHAGANALILWGVIWAAAYTAGGLLPPDHWWYGWLPGNIVGALGTAWLFRPSARNPGKGKGNTWIILAAALCFVSALYSTNPPHSAHQAEAIPAYILALLYMTLGAGRLSRYAAIGAVLFAATLLGYFALPSIMPFWMAAAGGGALILGGLWLKAA
jgi:hypothetical protein